MKSVNRLIAEQRVKARKKLSSDMEKEQHRLKLIENREKRESARAKKNPLAYAKRQKAQAERREKAQKALREVKKAASSLWGEFSRAAEKSLKNATKSKPARKRKTRKSKTRR